MRSSIASRAVSISTGIAIPRARSRRHDLQAVQVGQPDVEHDRVRAGAGDLDERLLARSRPTRCRSRRAPGPAAARRAAERSSSTMSTLIPRHCGDGVSGLSQLSASGQSPLCGWAGSWPHEFRHPSARRRRELGPIQLAVGRRRRARLQRAARRCPPRSAGCTTTSSDALPFALAHRHRRQRQHRRHAARSRAALAGDLPGVELLRLTEKGRGRALRAAWRASDADVVCYMDVDLSTDLRALLPLSRRWSPATATSRSARAWRAARASCAAPKRELISRAYNRLLHADAATRGSPTRSAASRPCAPTSPARLLPARARRRLVLRHRAARARPARRACASTRCRSTGSTTPTRAWTSCRTALEDLRGIARLLAAAR